MAIGHIEGIEVGATWTSKEEMHAAGVHINIRGGIAGKAEIGAESIALTGGYIDDEDLDDVIIYTGSGGRPEGSIKQLFDQEFTRHNKSLVTSCNNGTPVRVIRGSNHKSQYSPKKFF